jgi:hypothetical protein
MPTNDTPLGPLTEVEAYKAQILHLQQQLATKTDPDIPKLQDFKLESFKRKEWGRHARSWVNRSLRTLQLRNPGQELGLHHLQKLSLQLSGSLAEWWQHQVLVHGETGGFSSVIDFCNAIIRKCDDPNPDETTRNKIEQLVQVTSVAEYVNEFNILNDMLPYRHEGDSLHAFLKGLKFPILQQVTLRQPETLAKAQEIAHLVDQLLMSMRTAPSYKPPP